MEQPTETDIRSRPVMSQKLLLGFKWPHPLGVRLKEIDHEKGLEVGPGLWSVNQRTAVDAALVVIRALLEHTDKRLHRNVDGTELERAERNLPLVVYAWQDLPATLVDDHGDGEPTGNVADQQLELFKQLMASGEMPASSVGRPFYRLMESNQMVRYFWSRPEFLLWSKFEFQHPVNGDERKVEITKMPDPIPELQPFNALLDVSGHKAVGPSQEAFSHALAALGVSHWKWDGETSLERHLCKSALSWKETDGTGHKWIKRWNAGSIPVSLRVMYEVEQGAENSPGFDSLASVSFCPATVKQRPDGTHELGAGTLKLQYNLIAVVRLAKSDAEPNLVRVYSRHGRPVCPPEIQARKPAYVNNEWRLGEAGHTYMMYYVAYPVSSAPGPVSEHIANFGDALAIELVRSETYREDDGPSTKRMAPRPKGPRNRDGIQ